MFNDGGGETRVSRWKTSHRPIYIDNQRYLIRWAMAFIHQIYILLLGWSRGCHVIPLSPVLAFIYLWIYIHLALKNNNSWADWQLSRDNPSRARTSLQLQFNERAELSAAPPSSFPGAKCGEDLFETEDAFNQEMVDVGWPLPTLSRLPLVNVERSVRSRSSSSWTDEKWLRDVQLLQLLLLLLWWMEVSVPSESVIPLLWLSIRSWNPSATVTRYFSNAVS